ncbi:MAG TPA: hypothetical protein VFT66_10635 [Roseiflexaceae bacterium]|jgi:hypothetical protein|nr:hypothetical protein [Roseiflexaceae bacterium]
MGQECYEIHIKGHVSASWSDWFDGLVVTNLDGGEASISGPISDQAALHGVLARLYSLNLTLLSVRRVRPDGGELMQYRMDTSDPATAACCMAMVQAAD